MTSVNLIAMPAPSNAPTPARSAATGDAFEAEFKAASGATDRYQRQRSRNDASRADAPASNKASAASDDPTPGASGASDATAGQTGVDHSADQAPAADDALAAETATAALAASAADAPAADAPTSTGGTAADTAVVAAPVVPTALPTAVALAVAQTPAPATDSAGPGDASSGEAPQAPVAASAGQGAVAASASAAAATLAAPTGVSTASASGTLADVPADAAQVPGAAASAQREGTPVVANAGATGAVVTTNAGIQSATQPTTPAVDAGAVTEQGAAAGDRSSAQLQGTQGAQALNGMTPVQAQAPTANVAAPAPHLPTFPTPLASQLTGQLTSIKQLPQGDHVLTLMVNPESFGPVKVVAHIGRDGVSLEIFGATEAARAALRAALPDLRRDLAGAGLEPKLELGNGSGGQGASTDQSGLGQSTGEHRRAARATAGVGTTASANAAAPTITRTTHSGGIDLDL